MKIELYPLLYLQKEKNNISACCILKMYQYFEICWPEKLNIYLHFFYNKNNHVPNQVYCPVLINRLCLKCKLKSFLESILYFLIVFWLTLQEETIQRKGVNGSIITKQMQQFTIMPFSTFCSVWQVYM